MSEKLDQNKVAELWDLYENENDSTEKIISYIEADLNAGGGNWDAGDIAGALVEAGIFGTGES